MMANAQEPALAATPRTLPITERSLALIDQILQNRSAILPPIFGNSRENGYSAERIRSILERLKQSLNLAKRIPYVDKELFCDNVAHGVLSDNEVDSLRYGWGGFFSSPTPSEFADAKFVMSCIVGHLERSESAAATETA